MLIYLSKHNSLTIHQKPQKELIMHGHILFIKKSNAEIKAEQKNKSTHLFPVPEIYREIRDVFNRNKLSSTRLVDVFSPLASPEQRKLLALNDTTLKDRAMKNVLHFCYDLIKNFEDKKTVNDITFYLNNDVSFFHNCHIIAVSANGRQGNDEYFKNFNQAIQKLLEKFPFAVICSIDTINKKFDLIQLDKNKLKEEKSITQLKEQFALINENLFREAVLLISANAKQSEVKKLLGVSKEVYNLLKKRIAFAQDLIKLN